MDLNDLQIPIAKQWQQGDVNLHLIQLYKILMSRTVLCDYGPRERGRNLQGEIKSSAATEQRGIVTKAGTLANFFY